MGTKPLITMVAIVAALAVGAISLYVWDSGYDETISEGITIGGIDVGGMEPASARAQIRQNLVAPLDKPVRIKEGENTYKLKPEQIKIRADLDKMVGEALSKSQEGTFISRGWRRLSGGEVEHAVKPRIAYSRKSVKSFVDELAGQLNREPVNASVEPSASGLEMVQSQTGVQLASDKLYRGLEGALQDPVKRTVKAKVTTIDPEVSTDEVAAEYPTYLVVDRANFQIKLFEDLKQIKSYRIALGKAGNDTPSGLYSIQSKQVDPIWYVPNSDWAGDLAGTTVPGGVPENPLKARWLGIYNGVGVHGTADEASLGSNASHGCIRMAVPDVVELYDRVPTGTPIFIS